MGDEEIKSFQRKLGTVGGWVFNRESDGQQPMDRHLFNKWLTVAKQYAGLLKLEGVCGILTAGSGPRNGNTSPSRTWPWLEVGRTTKRCSPVYQRPDEESLLAVTSEPRKLKERVTRT